MTGEKFRTLGTLRLCQNPCTKIPPHFSIAVSSLRLCSLDDTSPALKLCLRNSKLPGECIYCLFQATLEARPLTSPPQSIYYCEFFLYLFELFMYILQFRNVFLKNLKAIPFKCDHQLEQDLSVPVSVGEQNPNFPICHGGYICPNCIYNDQNYYVIILLESLLSSSTSRIFL